MKAIEVQTASRSIVLENGSIDLRMLLRFYIGMNYNVHASMILFVAKILEWE